MTEWWNALGNAGQVFACIAIPATVMLLIQMVLTILGLSNDADTDVETEIDDADEALHDRDIADGGLRLFTLRGFIAFFSVMGWVGTICCGSNLALPLSIAISAASGFLAMVVIAAIMKWLIGLQYDGTENINEALGASGTVYIRIPPSRSGKGKINVIIQGKLAEKSAVTDEETMLSYGEEVTVVGISGEETLIVRRKNKI